MDRAKLLVADDDDVTLTMLDAALSAHHDVVAVTGGQAALVAIAGVLLQLYLQLAGFTPGVSSGNVPPPVAYAVTNIIVFLVEAPALDLDGALRRCGNQPALLRTLITRFSREQADFCDRFEAAQHDDLERARQLAHRLKGTAGNLGLPGLAAMAGDLEGACSAGQEPQVQAVLARLRVLMQQHQAALQAWLDQAPVPA